MVDAYAVRLLLERPQPPTLLCALQAQAEGMLAVCRATGVRIPEDFSIFALTNSANERRAERLDLSSVLVRAELLGADAATQMLKLLEHEEVAESISIEVGKWTQRGSVGPAAQRAE